MIDGLTLHAEESHRVYRGAVQVTLTAGLAITLGVLASHPLARRFTGVTGVDAAIVVLAFVATLAGATWALRSSGYSSTRYRFWNSLETAAAIFGALYWVWCAGQSFSPFWVVYFAIVGQAASFGANIAWNTLVFSAAPAALAIGYALEGWSLSAIGTGAVGLIAVAGYRFSLAATRRAARAFDARREHDAQERELSVLRERERIGRDLHDGLAAELTGLTYRLSELGLSPNTEEELRTRLNDVLEEIRTVVWTLRRPRRTAGELVAWLRTRCHELGAGTMKVTVLLEGDEARELPGDVATHLVMGVLEAVRNAARHAGAKAVQVSLRLSTRAELEIVDDGRGLPGGTTRDSEGGLRNLQHRATAVGGTCAAETAASGGTRVTFSCPLP